MWLIQDEVAAAMAQAIKAGVCPTAEQQAAFLERGSAELLGAGADSLPRNMVVAGDTAEIRIDGVLTPKPDIIAFLLGGGNTTYASIQAALARAQTDGAIKRVVLNIDSPGGSMAGLFETLAAIEAFTKPIRVVASRAASAAYAIAAATRGTIEAVSPASEFGSIGVAAKLPLDEDTIDLTSTDAPKKRPDPRTPEGRAVIVEYLDSVHELFVSAIAKGRGVKPETVNQTYGRGATLLAGEAKRLGMIDKIAKPPAVPAAGDERRARAMRESSEPEATTMDLNTLKTSHPEVYAAAFAEGRAVAAKPRLVEPEPAQVVPIAPAARAPGQEKPMDLNALRTQYPELYASAVREGELKERDRVTAHLNYGTACGDIKLAVTAIKAGDPITQTAISEYMTAGMNRSDRAARQAETEAAGSVVAGVKPEAADMADTVADLVERELGKKAV
ncbi:MAG TPA: S49 family peptidase [Polyangiaceae bacterium]|nr:S49 family peptidase [Polyangiaceae bacterium]